MVKNWSNFVTFNYFYIFLGVDRHLFSLNIAAQKRGFKSKFLHEACNDSFVLLTTHIPHNQTIKAIKNNDVYISAGAGLAVAIPNGYSISYFPFNDDVLFLHVSSLNCVSINTETLLNEIIRALGDIKELFE